MSVRHAAYGAWEVLLGGPGRVAGPAAALQGARPPALAGQADVIAGGLEQVGVAVVLLAQDAPEVTALPQPVAGLAGQDGGPRGRTRGRDAEGVAEQHPLPRHPVEDRRL